MPATIKAIRRRHCKATPFLHSLATVLLKSYCQAPPASFFPYELIMARTRNRFPISERMLRCQKKQCASLEELVAIEAEINRTQPHVMERRALERRLNKRERALAGMLL